MWQNVAIFQKCQLDNLVDFEKCCKTRIYEKIGADTAENERNFAENLSRTRALDAPRGTRCPRLRARAVLRVPLAAAERLEIPP